MPQTPEKAAASRREDDPDPASPIGARGAMIASDLLMQGQREIIIVHDGLNYRLRVTSNNKLILTK